MEVVEGVHRIEAPLGDRIVCLYLLAGKEDSLLIDTGLDGTPREYLLPYLAQTGLDLGRLAWVINSHADFDHTAGNRSIKELAPQAKLLCHKLDRAMVEDMELIISDRYDELLDAHGIGETDESRAFMRENSRTSPVDLSLTGGEVIRLDGNWSVEVWHTPGHSRGHLTVFDPRSDALIVCDAALYNAVIRADGRPAFPPTYRYVEPYIASIERLQAVSTRMLLTSHYPIYTGSDAASFLAESRAYVDRVDGELCRVLREHVRAWTMKELISELAATLGDWPESANNALSQPLQGHLERLVSYGQVRQEPNRGHTTYEWIAD